MFSLLVPVFLAAFMWLVIFVFRPWDFWISMSVATSILMIIAIASGARVRWSISSVLRGVVLALALYVVFLVGNWILKAVPLIPHAGEHVASVYEQSSSLPLWLIALLLLFPIGPGEEMFWRGFVQRRAMEKWGRVPGFLFALAFYAGIHIPTGNPVLVLAAVVAGGVWGMAYAISGDLLMVVVSHALWDVLSFVVFPFH